MPSLPVPAAASMFKAAIILVVHGCHLPWNRGKTCLPLVEMTLIICFVQHLSSVTTWKTAITKRSYRPTNCTSNHLRFLFVLILNAVCFLKSTCCNRIEFLPKTSVVTKALSMNTEFIIVWVSQPDSILVRAKSMLFDLEEALDGRPFNSSKHY
jgi:hypothetical protein